MIAAIYARKSTQQDVMDDAKSVTRQIDGARAFIRKQGWTLDEAHVYTDDGVSGALFANRAEFQRMMRDAEAGAFETLVLFDLDRFGRNADKTMEALGRLDDAGVTVWDYSTGQAVDLESFGGHTMTFLKARFAQEQREQIRKHTRAAMRRKAEQGLVAGGKVFGYDNLRLGKGQVERKINDREAAVVREIYERAASGEGARSIALVLNKRKVPSPRAQQGRAHGWSVSTIRAVLERPLYRGIIEYGRTKKAYGRELRRHGVKGEKGQIPAPQDHVIRVEAPHLRIVDLDVAQRVDARRADLNRRYKESLAKGGRVPERAHGKYLLSGGMLVCPQCGSHFEARIAPWKGVRNVYICSTRRRKPGACSNTLALPIDYMDDQVLSVVEGVYLGTGQIEELIAHVDATPDPAAGLEERKARLQTEVARLVDSIAAGVPASAVAPQIKEREAELAKIEVDLRRPRPARPDLDGLRAALEQRSQDWKAELRAEPTAARLLLRRVLGPITLWDEAENGVRWDAEPKPAALLDGLVQHMASPTGFEPVFWP